MTEALKVAVVLTIPAAGSEGSGNSVITKVDTLQKLSLRVPELLRPVFSIMNPELTYTLPPFQTACGIADMMVHIMERYFTNTQDVEISDCLCEGTLTAIIKEAYRIKQNPGDYGRAPILCGVERLLITGLVVWVARKIGLRIFWNMKSVRFTTLRMAPDCL